MLVKYDFEQSYRLVLGLGKIYSLGVGTNIALLTSYKTIPKQRSKLSCNFRKSKGESVDFSLQNV